MIWWLDPHLSPAVVALLAFFELVLVFGGVWRVLTASTFSSLPDRRPMSPPSVRPLDPPGTPPERSAQPAEIPAAGPRQAVAEPANDAHQRVLVVASEAPSSEQLQHALGGRGADDLEVLVVAPALHDSALQFWLSDADDAIQRANDVQAATVAKLRDQDVTVTGTLPRATSSRPFRTPWSASRPTALFSLSTRPATSVPTSM